MQTVTKWHLKEAELNLKVAQEKVAKEDAHKLQAAVEIIKAVAQKQDIKNG